jgi:hypothetical protein
MKGKRTIEVHIPWLSSKSSLKYAVAILKANDMFDGILAPFGTQQALWHEIWMFSS